ncbi:MAG: NADH-quinone oxidoreductase subunit A [Pyrinomonadaceae bacterium]|nr:NADH-quinone oxidoreductase subunit A [Phycisphaerales bacterium]
MPLITLAAVDVASYIPVMILITMAISFGIINVVASRLIGPRRDGAIKSETYESGMAPIGTARKRFNVRFYLIAMVFLVFDIEIIFLYPWAATFRNLEIGSDTSMIWFARILFFMFTSVIAYIYAYRKGVFRFD